MIFSNVIRQRLSRRRVLMLASVLLDLFGQAAHASTILTSPDCSAAPDNLGCHLVALLNLLYVAAGVLSAVLVVVIVVAIRAYKKNSKDDEGEI